MLVQLPHTIVDKGIKMGKNIMNALVMYIIG